MQTIKTSRHVTKLLALPLLIMTSFAAHSAEMPPAPGVLDSYQCVFKPGKDMQDLMAARDFYVKQAAKADYTTPPAYIWQLAKGDAPVDIVWFDLHANLAAFAASADAAAESAEMTTANERFESVITCQSGIGTVQTIQQRSEVGDGTAFISSSACMLNHGQSQQDVSDLVMHIAGVAEQMGDKAPNASYLGTPITSGPNTPDFYVFSANESVTAWSEFVTELRTTPAGQMLGRHFNKVFDCSSSMWTGQWAINPES